MSDILLVKHCSPTLAGMKTGNLFSCSFETENDMKDFVRYWNRQLTKKGLRIVPMRYQNGSALIYVFRPAKLSEDLNNKLAEKLLKERGYCTEKSQLCVIHLIDRICESNEFPHEIGLFLGYPPQDVYGFIENKEESCKCVGFWKVYSNEDMAQKIFAKYKKCIAVYSEQFEKGRTIEQLAVAG